MNVFETVKNLWNNRAFEILLALCIAFILIYALYRKFSGKKGTWSNDYYLPGINNNIYTHSNSRYNTNTKQPCKDSKGEIECRRVMEYIFKKPFPKARPDFLRNPVSGGSYCLELDCFNQDLKLAVEYNGIQHYKYVPYFHRNKEAFLNQKYRDDMKYRICKEKGIYLIIVPYMIKIENIKQYIEKELINIGIKT